MRIHHAAFSLLLATVMPMSGLADDGVVEINQACAVNGGCFAGDSSGFPVEVSHAGSYVLTGALDVPEGTSAINISANEVFVDLRGHTIGGPVTCSGSPVSSCSATGSAGGIVASTVSSGSRVEIVNGAVRGFEGAGISVGGEAAIRNIRVAHNGGDGIATGSSSLLERVFAVQNGENGLVTSSRSIVENSIADGNGSNGLEAQGLVTATESTFSRNGNDGIIMFGSGLVDNVTSRDNVDSGLQFGSSSGTVTNSVITQNDGAGVNCGSALTKSVSLTNVVMNNNNGAGDQYVGSCVETGENVCGVGTACP